MSHHVFTPKYNAYFAKVDATPIPYTFQQAAPQQEWFKEMKDEISSLESTNTWQVVLENGKV